LVVEALQITKGLAVDIFGIGFTVTIMLYGEPIQEPIVEVGVTRYSTVPDAALLGFVRIWLIVLPEPAEAPVILPVIVPTAHVKLLGALAVKAIFGPVPLQVLAVAAVVTTGVGLTATTILLAAPIHKPVIEVGVTRYSTVPAVALLGLVRTWLIVLPEFGVAPVIPPVTAPIVHAKVLGVLAVNAIFGPVPLQVLAVAVFVTAGVGLTVTTILYGLPIHKPVVAVGVTRYSTVPVAALLGFESV